MTVSSLNREGTKIAACGALPYGTTKVHDHHLERLAIVYVRQSTLRQVAENRESTELQYDLVHRAVAVGWKPDRVLVIDDDQGQSGSTAANRAGFQRLLAEVSLNHVGLVLGTEMSRLARSCKDWYHLLEVCGLFGVLLADQDGLYDPCDYNDRLLLGLKGTLSEAELHILRTRLLQGKLNKARRGELFYRVPIGYILLPTGEVILDPDEQVQAAVRLVFEKFNELGSCRQLMHYLLKNNIRLPVRLNDGPDRGQLEWRVPNPRRLYIMLHHPMYAGTYSHGRTAIDPRRRVPGKRDVGRVTVPMDQWPVLHKDHLPAYITWEQYLANQERLTQNRAVFETMGAPREGAALLGGLVACGCCGWRMYVAYRDKPHAPRYSCRRDGKTYVGDRCPSIAARAVDELVGRQVLRALQPASLELSIRAEEDMRREQGRLDKHWQQRLERARYEAERARRQYDAVEPENRLVARELERRWQQTLEEEQKIREEYTRFQSDQVGVLTEKDRELARSLASDIPALWNAETTTFADRQTIIRHLVERVVIHVHGNTEVVDVTIHWAGGFESQHQIVRPVGCYQQLRDFDRLIERMCELRDTGCTADQIAEHLNAEGFHSPRGNHLYTGNSVRQLFRRCGLVKRRRGIPEDPPSDPNEWWMEDLMRELDMPLPTLLRWCHRGWLHARKVRTSVDRWLIWADAEELQRLRKLRAYRRPAPRVPYPAELTTPKQRIK